MSKELKVKKSWSFPYPSVQTVSACLAAIFVAVTAASVDPKAKDQNTMPGRFYSSHSSFSDFPEKASKILHLKRG